MHESLNLDMSGPAGADRMKHPRRRFGSKIFFVLALGSLLVSSLAQRYMGANEKVSNRNIDFYVYYFAAQVVHDNPHANLYAGATGENPQARYATGDSELSEHAKLVGANSAMFYIYPPLLADLLVPLSQVPSHIAASVWCSLNLVLVFMSVFFLARMQQIPILSFEFVALTWAAYSFFPINEAIFVGQITIVMLVLWAVGILAYSEDRMILSAAAFALATAFKVTPILILPLFFIWKDRRWLLSYLTISLGLVAMMVGINGLPIVSAYPSVVSAMGDGIPYALNKTIGSLVAWVYYGRVFTFGSALDLMPQPPHALSVVAKTISGAFYLACLFLVWRRPQVLRTHRAATIAVFGLVTACVSPVSWRHGYTVAFIALAIFWVRVLRNRSRAIQVVLLTATTVALGCVFFDLAVEANVPQVCKILMSASWVVFSVLFCLDALYHTNADGHWASER
jgi:Glycosyltransferase family 87